MVKFHGILVNSMEFCSVPWAFHGILFKFHGTLLQFKKFKVEPVYSVHNNLSEVSKKVQNGSETSGDTKSDGRNVSSDDKSKKASDDKSQGFPKDFLDRLETTIMNIQQRQAQQQEQMEQMILAQKREKELQPPEWFLRWKMTA